MKKTILLLALSYAALYPQEANAQKKPVNTDCEYRVNVLKSQNDSLQLLYNDVLGILDSTIGTNNKLKEQLNKQKLELNKAKKQISDQNAKIEKFEADVKRLSQSSNKKSTTP
jgi:septal ring factor EnvC (AmiA/AmiB activator)